LLFAAQSGGVAFWAHVGGFISGMILILAGVLRSRQFMNLHGDGLQ
jgi:membrane associated rhomboid family serine protease